MAFLLHSILVSGIGIESCFPTTLHPCSKPYRSRRSITSHHRLNNRESSHVTVRSQQKNVKRSLLRRHARTMKYGILCYIRRMQMLFEGQRLRVRASRQSDIFFFFHIIAEITRELSLIKIVHYFYNHLDEYSDTISTDSYILFLLLGQILVRCFYSCNKFFCTHLSYRYFFIVSRHFSLFSLLQVC